MKHFYFAAFAALLVLAQCQKDSPEGTTVTPEPIDTTSTTPPVFRDTLAVPRFVYVIGDDVGGGYYYPDTLFTGNFMRVLRYDTLSQIVEGAFHFVMNVDKQTGNIPGIPDTISMTNGYFKVKIKQ